MNEKVKLNPTEARQGKRGTSVLTILVVALILAAIGGWAVGLFGESIEPANPVGGAPTEQPVESPGAAEAVD